MSDRITKEEVSVFNITSEFNPEHKISIKVQTNGHGITITPEGYSDGNGSAPIFLDFINEKGDFGVYIWGDKREDDPTHIISLKDVKDLGDKFAVLIDADSISDEEEVYSLLGEADIFFQESLSIQPPELKLMFANEETMSRAIEILSPLNPTYKEL